MSSPPKKKAGGRTTPKGTRPPAKKKAAAPADETLQVDLDSFTMAEVEELEDRARMGIQGIVDAIERNEDPDLPASEKPPLARVTRALWFVISRRTNPEVTWEDAGDVEFGGDALSVVGRPPGAEDDTEGGDEDRPTSAADESS